MTHNLLNKDSNFPSLEKPESSFSISVAMSTFCSILSCPPPHFYEDSTERENVLIRIQSHIPPPPIMRTRSKRYNELA